MIRRRWWWCPRWYNYDDVIDVDEIVAPYLYNCISSCLLVYPGTRVLPPSSVWRPTQSVHRVVRFSCHDATQLFPNPFIYQHCGIHHWFSIFYPLPCKLLKMRHPLVLSQVLLKCWWVFLFGGGGGVPFYPMLDMPPIIILTNSLSVFASQMFWKL